MKKYKPKDYRCPKCDHKVEYIGGQVYLVAFGVTCKYLPNQYFCAKCGRVYYDRRGELITHPTGVYH